MNKYFAILNWLLLAAVISIWVFLAPWLGGWPVVAGAIMGAMLTGGSASWMFFKDKTPDKEFKWRKRYFSKDYMTEIDVWGFFVAVSFLAGLLFWRYFYVCMGFSLIWFINILIEAGWAKWHRYGKDK